MKKIIYTVFCEEKDFPESREVFYFTTIEEAREKIYSLLGHTIVDTYADYQKDYNGEMPHEGMSLFLTNLKDMFSQFYITKSEEGDFPDSFVESLELGPYIFEIHQGVIDC